MIVFGDGASKEIVMLRSLELKWALIQSDWYPDKKRKFGHTQKWQGYEYPEERSHEVIARREPSASHGERP